MSTKGSIFDSYVMMIIFPLKLSWEKSNLSREFSVYVCVLLNNNNIEEGNTFYFIHGIRQVRNMKRVQITHAALELIVSIVKNKKLFFYHSKGFCSKATFCSL